MAATNPPPFFITPDDKRGLLIVTGAIVLAYVWTCFIIRLWLRWQTREWRADDWALAVATFLNTTQSAVIFHLVNLGLGATLQDLSQSQLQQLGKEGFVSQLLYIYVLYASKLSVLFLYLRLSSRGGHGLASRGVIVASSIWALLSTVLIATPCNPLQAFEKDVTCTNRWPKWQAIGALDIVTEIFIFGIAIQLVWGLQMPTRAKLLVIFAFSARLPVVGIAGIRLYLWHRLTTSSSTYEYVVATQWQMGYAIMSSTITGMGPFLRPFNKEYTTSNYKRSAYGLGSQPSTQPASSTMDSAALRPRASWRSQSYLMETLPSRRDSNTMLPDSAQPIGMTNNHPTSHVSHPSTSTISEPAQASPTSQAPIMFTADEDFRPTDHFRRHEAEVWAGDRSSSINRDKELLRSRQERMVVNKRMDFKVEVDRASRVA
ncbi:hypothetical protein T440DRAFT_471833 [Plenodomus tracheiphilus IPT5]|uniref:Rhodopsin domain-containing protein n=1 Tax=Plenodomus tracheiphilus IPT5 TaxID=1408161 RepID=A0A6A7ATK1_9PLEO|nr:hypothetical protein T440DRAFT_471833 [Plenodomus tracheiphilus IPT5]